MFYFWKKFFVIFCYDRLRMFQQKFVLATLQVIKSLQPEYSYRLHTANKPISGHQAYRISRLTVPSCISLNEAYMSHSRTLHTIQAPSSTCINSEFYSLLFKLLAVKKRCLSLIKQLIRLVSLSLCVRARVCVCVCVCLSVFMIHRSNSTKWTDSRCMAPATCYAGVYTVQTIQFTQTDDDTRVSMTRETRQDSSSTINCAHTTASLDFISARCTVRTINNNVNIIRRICLIRFRRQHQHHQFICSKQFNSTIHEQAVAF